MDQSRKGVSLNRSVAVPMRHAAAHGSPRLSSQCRLLLAAIGAFIWPLGAGSLQGATVLAHWQMAGAFPTGTGNVPTGTTYLPPNLTDPDGTPSAGELAGSPSAILLSFHAASATTYTSPAGNGSSYSFSSNNWAPGDYYQISLPTTAMASLSVSWDQAKSSTGPAAFKLTMSTDGSNFSDLFSYTVLQSGGGGAPGTWSTTTYNSLYTNVFGLPSTADNQTNLILRFVNAEAAVSGASGANRIDNIMVTATAIPEPSSSMASLCLLAAGTLVRRRARRVGNVASQDRKA